MEVLNPLEEAAAERALRQINEAYKQYKEGVLEIHDVINVIESNERLKRAFVRYVIERVEDELRNYKITDHIDGYNYFSPFKEKVDITIERFCEAMQTSRNRLLF